MKLSILSVVAGLSVLANTTRVVPGNTTPQVARTDKIDPAATAVSGDDLVLDHAHPDTGITVPPPGSFCLECSLWENDCKERCGGGRACKDFCKCERAKRKPCRYSGCEGKKPGNCANKPRSMIEHKAVPNGLPGYWKSFGFGV